MTENFDKLKAQKDAITKAHDDAIRAEAYREVGEWLNSLATVMTSYDKQGVVSMKHLLSEEGIRKAYQQESERTHNLEIQHIPNHWDFAVAAAEHQAHIDALKDYADGKVSLERLAERLQMNVYQLILVLRRYPQSPVADQPPVEAGELLLTDEEVRIWDEDLPSFFEAGTFPEIELETYGLAVARAQLAKVQAHYAAEDARYESELQEIKASLKMSLNNLEEIKAGIAAKDKAFEAMKEVCRLAIRNETKADELRGNGMVDDVDIKALRSTAKYARAALAQAEKVK